MAFTLPSFNLTVNVWRGPTAFPPVGAPIAVVVGNLTPGRRGPLLPSDAGQDMYILLPALADVRSLINAADGDTLEVPAGTGRYYRVVFVDDIAKGFPNEHRFAMLEQAGTWPAPMP